MTGFLEKASEYYSYIFALRMLPNTVVVHECGWHDPCWCLPCMTHNTGFIVHFLTALIYYVLLTKNILYFEVVMRKVKLVFVFLSMLTNLGLILKREEDSDIRFVPVVDVLVAVPHAVHQICLQTNKQKIQ